MSFFIIFSHFLRCVCDLFFLVRPTVLVFVNKAQDDISYDNKLRYLECQFHYFHYFKQHPNHRVFQVGIIYQSKRAILIFHTTFSTMPFLFVINSEGYGGVVALNCLQKPRKMEFLTKKGPLSIFAKFVNNCIVLATFSRNSPLKQSIF